MLQSYYVTKLIKIALCLKTYIDFFALIQIKIGMHLNIGMHLLLNLVYDVSFQKLLQLIVDGDVESNPGPSNTVTGVPKGRKTKRTTFFTLKSTLSIHTRSPLPNFFFSKFFFISGIYIFQFMKISKNILDPGFTRGGPM